MPQLKVKRIHLRNWTTVQDQTVDLPEFGLIYVSGSVGAGKTALGEALSRTILGVAGRYTHYGHYSRGDKGNTLVTVEGSFGQEKFKIQSGYKSKELSSTGEGLVFNFTGTETARPHVNQTREELSKIVGVQPELAEWTVFINGDNLDWGDSSLSSQEKVNLLMMALNQPSWETYHDSTKQARNLVKIDLAEKEGRLSSTQQAVQGAIELVAKAEATFKAEQDRFDEARRLNAAKIQEAKTKLAEYEASLASCLATKQETKLAIKRIEDTLATEIHAVEIEEMELSAKKATISQTELQPIEVKKLSVESTITELKNQLTSLQSKKQKPKACSQCGRPFTGQEDEAKHREEETKSLTERMAKYRENLTALETSSEPIRLRLAKVNADISAILAKKRSISNNHSTSDLSDRLDVLDVTATRLNRSINTQKIEIANLEKGPSTDALVRAKSVMDDRRTQLKTLRESLPAIEEDVKSDRLTVSALDYWASAFSPAGIPNRILHKSIEPLNQVSQVLSHRITANKLAVAFSTTKLTATNEQRNGLTVQVKNAAGATRAGGGSKGESGLTNFIIAETLSTVGRISHRVGFRWYDEVLNTQDSLTRQRILIYLREKANELKIPIFFVSHHADVAGLADYTLLAEKKDDVGTVYHWA